MPSKTTIGTTTAGILITLGATGTLIGLPFKVVNDHVKPLIYGYINSLGNNLTQNAGAILAGNAYIPSITFNSTGDFILPANPNYPINANTVRGTMVSHTQPLQIPITQLFPTTAEIPKLIPAFIDPIASIFENISLWLVVTLGVLAGLMTLLGGLNFTYTGYVHASVRENSGEIREHAEEIEHLREQSRRLEHRILLLEQHLRLPHDEEDVVSHDESDALTARRNTV